MFGRKKTGASPTRQASRGPRLGSDEIVGVLRAFLVAPPSNPYDPNPAAPSFTAASPAPGSASPFAYATTEFFGAEGSPQLASGAGQDRVVNYPGIGPVTTGQLQQATQRIEQVLQQISGGSDLWQNPTPAVLMAVLQRLDSLRARGGVTGEQYDALVAAAASLSE